MAKIHQSSSIDSKAQLADDVEIGPNCLIEGQVMLGSGTRLIGHVWLKGPLTVGESNVFYPNSCIGFEPQHRRYVPGTGAGVAIGNGNVFREGVTIHASTAEHPTRVGNQNYLMCNTHLGHDAVIGNQCTLANGALLGGHVTVDDSAFIGGNGAVHQFCRVGRLAMLGGGAIVTQDIPPFCTVYETRVLGSLNLVGLRRAGYRASIANLKRAFDLLFLQRHTAPVAINLVEKELASDPLCAELIAFLRKTKRGITTRLVSSDVADD